MQNIMPLRMIDVAGISYAYVILLGEEACTAMVYSGSITHLELARLVMHHAQNVMTTLDCNDGIFWAWTGPIHKLSLVMGSPIWSSCACCFKRAALSDSSKCCRCHYFRYCSSECMKKHWRVCHKRLCAPMSRAYDHQQRRDTRYGKVAYGFMSAYEYNMWKHLLSDPAFNREVDWNEPLVRFGRRG